MNIPYAKKYDETGVITNPIKHFYPQEFDNRRERRSEITKIPFFGNGKNHPLTVYKTCKYLRMRQTIHCRDKKTKQLTGEIRVIEHYVLK